MDNKQMGGKVGGHTPGPWELIEGNTLSVFADDALICTAAERHMHITQAHANARLVAAAPCLVEALEAIMARIEGDFDNPALVAFGPLLESAVADCGHLARAALAKARGTGEGV